MNTKQKGKLPLLRREFYSGWAVVFWTLTIEHRAQGWLNVSFHARFRELMLHAAARSHLLCPTYCLMPDHLHFVWMGLHQQSNQLNAMKKFLRIHLEPELGDSVDGSTSHTTVCFGLRSGSETPLARRVRIFWPIR